MNAPAKVLAAIVLTGSAFGLVTRALGLVTMNRLGAFDNVLADGAAAAIYFGEFALGAFFTTCSIALSIMVLIHRPKADVAKVFS